MGLRIYPQYHPHQHGCSGPEYPAYFRSLTSFHNGGEGAFCRSCGRIHWVDFNVVEVNGPFASFKKFDVEYNWDPNIVVSGASPTFACHLCRCVMLCVRGVVSHYVCRCL